MHGLATTCSIQHITHNKRTSQLLGLAQRAESVKKANRSKFDFQDTGDSPRDPTLLQLNRENWTDSNAVNYSSGLAVP